MAFTNNISFDHFSDLNIDAHSKVFHINSAFSLLSSRDKKVFLSHNKYIPHYLNHMSYYIKDNLEEYFFKYYLDLTFFSRYTTRPLTRPVLQNTFFSGNFDPYSTNTPFKKDRKTSFMVSEGIISIPFFHLYQPLKENIIQNIKYSPFVKKKYLRSNHSYAGVKKQLFDDYLPYVMLVSENFLKIPYQQRVEDASSMTEEDFQNNLVLFVASDLHALFKNDPITKSFSVSVEKVIINPLIEKNVKVVFCPSEHITKNVFKTVDNSYRQIYKKTVLKEAILSYFQ